MAKRSHATGLLSPSRRVPCCGPTATWHSHRGGAPRREGRLRLGLGRRLSAGASSRRTSHPPGRGRRRDDSVALGTAVLLPCFGTLFTLAHTLATSIALPKAASS